MSDEKVDVAVGRKVAELRDARGMTQSELAEAVTVRSGRPFHQQTVLRIEKGLRPLRFMEGVHIADALSVELNSLLAEDHSVTKEYLQLRADLGELEAVTTRVEQAVELGQHLVSSITASVGRHSLWSSLTTMQQREIRESLIDLHRRLDRAVGEFEYPIGALPDQLQVRSDTEA